MASFMKSLPLLILSCLLVSGTSTLSVASAEKLEGFVKVDGSSTVFPITEAVAEEFRMKQGKVRVTVGVSGTGGGFKKFCAGEIDINDASRRIKKKEADKCKKNGLKFEEFAVAYDGISVVINKENTWVDKLTVKELKTIWEPGSRVKTWKDVRSTWPDKKIKLYGPGTDSGTFDYFTDAINGKSQASRADFTKSEDDNVLVNGVAGDKGSLGYFGFAYYKENRDKIKAVPIVNDKGKAVSPTMESINSSAYNPLSRPVFIYVSEKSVQKKQVRAFVDFYLKNAGMLSKDVGYVPLPQAKYDEALTRLNKLAEPAKLANN